MKAPSISLHGYVQVGRGREGFPNGLGNLNFENKILFMSALRTTLKSPITHWPKGEF